jgi:hypothetical protein
MLDAIADDSMEEDNKDHESDDTSTSDSEGRSGVVRTLKYLPNPPKLEPPPKLGAMYINKVINEVAEDIITTRTQTLDNATNEEQNTTYIAESTMKAEVPITEEDTNQYSNLHFP